MSKAIAISAFGSNSGKTLLSTALLYHFRGRVRGFKVGPDFIDPLFHKKISKKESINLDGFMMNKTQLKWIFDKYCDEEFAIVEGVMGFYDGEEKGASTNIITKLLRIPTILVIDCSGSYITISALLKGLREYKTPNQIKGVVLNKVSSTSHFELIKQILQKDHPDIKILGWIQKDLSSLKSIHLGLDLNELSKISQISKEVLKNIDLKALEMFAKEIPKNLIKYPFKEFKKIEKKLAIVNDENFSFLYYDNLKFLEEMFQEVEIIQSTKDQEIPKDCDIVYIPGGYVETSLAYEKIKNSSKFRNSLIFHVKNKKAIYAECAGLLYLGRRVDQKKMSQILDLEFKLQKKFVRLGYYYTQNGIKGHCFHYTKPTQETLKKGFCKLSKTPKKDGEVGSWKENNIFGTFLHTFFRLYPDLILKSTNQI